MILLRFYSALLSAYIFSVFLSGLLFSLWELSSPAYPLGACEEIFEERERLAANFKIIAGCLWVMTWAYLEFLASRRGEHQKSRLLTHLRYGPIAILLFSLVVTLFTDLLLIQYSRWQIVRYIHSDAPPEIQPTFKLHNYYRYSCENGSAAVEYALYGETPAKEFDNPDPATRARALQASVYVYDWVNNRQDGPSIEVLKKALDDPDPLVRSIAKEHYSELLVGPE
jgi:hypothetical protein